MLRAALGDQAVLTGEAVTEFASGWSDLGAPVALVRPADTDQVAAAARICHQAGIPMVPWGGRTGLVAGACADGAVAISLDRMNRIEEVDPVDGVMLVQAGCVVATACEAAEQVDMFFPLDLGSRGSATIGGVISTNAGGNRVVRFGMTRQLVLGIEVVLADGTVLSSLHPLIKNNTGYDLTQLFCGAEGTLGIVTRAVLRLRPAMPGRNVAFVAVEDFNCVTRLLRRLESRLGGQLSAFEVMWPEYYHLVTTPPALGRPVLAHSHGYYILVETMGADRGEDASHFETVLASAMEEGLVSDAVIAKSEAEAARMWALRDDGEQVGRIGPYLPFDVSLRVSRIAPFVAELRAGLELQWPGKQSVVFGHVGDGNIHLVIAAGDNSAAQREAITDIVLNLVGKYEGSISAEHGIGLDKLPYLHLSRSPQEIAAMQRIKHALDPDNIMNPGKVLPAPCPSDAGGAAL
ncbi:MAG: FAD-binding oxidoreductase [Novosphingobium sp.]|nr:FAD-binding oxidoreductase [Novosphingobium sp.]